MRLFVSIDLAVPVREKLHGWLPEHPDLRQTKKEQLHLTLLFLGECDEDELILISKRLKTIQFDPFEMTIKGVGAFPNRKNPGVIWAGVSKSSELINLQKQISNKLSAFADSSGNHLFKPHITLARTTKRFKLKKSDSLFQKEESISVKVESISLKKSVLSAEGSIHTTLGKYNAEKKNS
jgi:2'-5' RNA ligase